MKKFLLILMATVSVCGQLTVTQLAHAQGFSASAFLPNEVVFGNTYSEWAAAWNQWFISIPASINPSLDNSGKNCDQRQNQRAFFLAGNGNFPTPPKVTRSCTVPCGKPLFFPLLTVECSNVEADPFFGANPTDRLVCAQQLGDLIDVGSLKTTIDGVDVTSLNRFRVAGPDTDFKMSPTDNVLFVMGASKGFSTTDGYWLMLKPLSGGNHVLHFEASIPVLPPPLSGNFTQDVTYDLSVKGSCSHSQD